MPVQQAVNQKNISVLSLQDLDSIYGTSCNDIIETYKEQILFAADKKAAIEEVQNKLKPIVKFGYDCKRYGRNVTLKMLESDSHFRAIVKACGDYYYDPNDGGWYWDCISTDLYEGMLLADYVYSVNTENPAEKATKLTVRQRVNLLNRLGVFDLEKVKELTTQNQGALFSLILSNGAKNTEDIIRERHTDLPVKQQEQLTQLLKELSIKTL